MREYKVRLVTTYFVWAETEDQAIEKASAMAEVTDTNDDRFHIEVPEVEP